MSKALRSLRYFRASLIWPSDSRHEVRADPDSHRRRHVPATDEDEEELANEEPDSGGRREYDEELEHEEAEVIEEVAERYRPIPFVEASRELRSRLVDRPYRGVRPPYEE